jgi:hypothetical protein
MCVEGGENVMMGGWEIEYKSRSSGVWTDIGYRIYCTEN